MKISEVKKLSPMERLLYWIQERESVRLKKEAGKPKPWTDDEILQKFRFCNVRRMDDRVSRWLLENWYKPNFDHPNMLIACALARHFNNPTSLGAIGFPKTWQPAKIKRTIRELKSSGQRVFNAAYRVCGKEGDDLIESVVDYTIQPLVDDPPAIDCNSMKSTWEAVVPCHYFGSFMAGQLVADLCWGLKGNWRDRNIWACAGPGSKRGLNRLLGRALQQPLKQDEFLKHLQWMISVCRRELPKAISARLEAHDYQNCLCEYDKFNRVLFGEGRHKQLYPGLR